MKQATVAIAILVAVFHGSLVAGVASADETANQNKKVTAQTEELQERFTWWPTDATPRATLDEERGGYWWMPSEPGKIRPWGNRGYVYVYKIIFDYQSDRLPNPKDNELRPSLLIRKIDTNIKIYFDYDSAVLRSDGKTMLKRALRTLKNSPDSSVLVTGNADVRGTETYNMNLAKERAEAIREYLVQNRIKTDRVRIVSHGKLNAVAPVTDLIGMQKDRNAQFMIAEVDEVMLPYRPKPGDKVTKLGKNKLKVETKQTLESDVKVSTRKYVVKEGDTLSKISEAELGSAYRWEYLFEINKDRIRHPDQLRPGTVIVIPVE